MSIPPLPAQPPDPQPGTPGRPELRWPIELFHHTAAEVPFRQNRNVLLTNSPLAFAMFYGTRTVGNYLSKKKAVQQAAPQWRPAGAGEAILDDAGITLTGPWGTVRLDFGEIAGWDRTPDALVLNPSSDTDPVYLRSPGAPALAQWFAQLSEGKLWRPAPAISWPAPPDDGLTRWERRDPRLAFALAEGWGPYSDPGYLAKAGNDYAAGGQQLLLVLRFDTMACDAFAELSQVIDPTVVQALGADPAALERNSAAFARSRAAAISGAVLAASVPVMIGGERSSMIDMSTSVPGFRVRIREFYFGHRGTWFVLSYSVTHNIDPQPHFDALFPGVQQMVATWRWMS